MVCHSCDGSQWAIYEVCFFRNGCGWIDEEE